jgi:hypothetical protein
MTARCSSGNRNNGGSIGIVPVVQKRLTNPYPGVRNPSNIIPKKYGTNRMPRSLTANAIQYLSIRSPMSWEEFQLLKKMMEL